MNKMQSFIRRRLPLWRRVRLACEESGVAAVEFSLILPIMITLWIGGIEITDALSVDRRVNGFASSMGDLTARTKTITYAQIEDIFDLSEAAMFPYQDSGMSMRISAVDIDDDGNAKVAWSRSRGTGYPAYAKTTDVNSSVPVALRGAPGQIIMAEAEKEYVPAIGYVIVKSLGEVDLDSRMFFVPRLTNQIKICPTADVATCVVTI